MAQATVVEVVGLREVVRNLERLGTQAEDLKGAFSRVGAKAESHAQSTAPRRTGDLAASVRQSKRKNSVYLYAGKARTHPGRWSPYGPIVHFGWGRRGIEAQPWMYRTVAVWGPWAAQEVEREMQALIRKLGFSDGA
jgi:hypothetical protein